MLRLALRLPLGVALKERCIALNLFAFAYRPRHERLDRELLVDRIHLAPLADGDAGEPLLTFRFVELFGAFAPIAILP